MFDLRDCQTLRDHNVQEVVNTPQSFFNLFCQFGNGAQHVSSIVRSADFVNIGRKTWNLSDGFVQMLSNVLGSVATLCSPAVHQKLYKGPIFADVVKGDAKIGIKIPKNLKNLNIKVFKKN